MKQSILFVACLLALGGLATHRAQAQGAPPSGGPVPDPDPVDVPLDGGAVLLAGSGVALGVRLLRQRRRQA